MNGHDNQYEDLLLDALLDRGFSYEEAMRLIVLQDRILDERREVEEWRKLTNWMRQGRQGSREPQRGEPE